MPRNADGHGSEKRVTRRIVRALKCMIHQGKSRAEAAEAAGLKERSLIVALRKPHVRAFRNSLGRGHIDMEAERSVAVLVRLRDTAASEHVQLEAAKHLAALGGIRPPTESSVNINVGGGTPRWIIDLTPRARPPLIEHSPQQIVDANGNAPAA